MVSVLERVDCIGKGNYTIQYRKIDNDLLQQSLILVLFRFHHEPVVILTGKGKGKENYNTIQFFR